ncbi:carboxypeptidase-like regulatory domain-containing protein [Catalinimonas niigatensis]|uniref:carboxypeptidase-like regulatory domain-containing protein n=1 Tax=Catalinimonas niigatensis TaxID=1397264 RepID=UPI00266524ED|nr:carboxypeptidase-like regulatory domain-containing protein [Catalinimonas niigatensis]WPP53128.1 carboxypeptidase-like regulatory domain-containing protein [Catalinimonas niigatensis]
MKDISKLVVIAICVFFILSFAAEKAKAQGKSSIIQLSGLVLGEDSTSALAGANIYVPAAGRGISTNQYGYFSLPVLAGDSVIISSIGYKKQYYLVPEKQKESLTIVVELQSDTTYLPGVVVFPFPTEQIFKEAVLALELPDQNQYDNMNENLNADLLARMFEAMPMDGSMNHRYFMNQQFDRLQYGAGPRPNPLLNPFAWAEFIKSLKRGDFKKK